MTILELLLALVAILGAAVLFTNAVEILGERLEMGGGSVGSIMAAVGTALPEKFNSVIWVREDKDVLALGNITGAMVFQSTLPVTLGLLFTQWKLNFIGVFAVVIALLSGGAFYLLLRSKRPMRALYLMGGGIMYLVFLCVAVVTIL